jgi:hypothetical protein
MPKQRATKSKFFDITVIDQVANGAGSIPSTFPDERRSDKLVDSRDKSEAESPPVTSKSQARARNIPNLTKPSPYTRAINKHKMNINNMANTRITQNSYISPVHKRSNTKSKTTSPCILRNSALNCNTTCTNSSLTAIQPINNEYTQTSDIRQTTKTRNESNENKVAKQISSRRNNNYDRNRIDLNANSNLNLTTHNNKNTYNAQLITQSDEFHNTYNINTNNHFSLLDKLNCNLESNNDKNHNAITKSSDSNQNTIIEEASNTQESSSLTYDTLNNSKLNLPQAQPSSIETSHSDRLDETTSPKQGAIKEILQAWNERRSDIENKIQSHLLNFIEKQEEADIAKTEYLKILESSEKDLDNNTQLTFKEINKVEEMSEDKFTAEEQALWEKLSEKKQRIQRHDRTTTNNDISPTTSQIEPNSRKRKLDKATNNNYTNELDNTFDNVIDMYDEFSNETKTQNNGDNNTRASTGVNTEQYTEYIHYYESQNDIDEKFIDSLENWNAINNKHQITDFELTFDPKDKKKITVRTRCKKVHEVLNSDLNDTLGTNLKHINHIEKTGRTKWLKIVVHKTQRELNDNELSYLKRELQSTFIKKDGTTTRDNIKYKAAVTNPDIYTTILEKGFIQIGSKKVWCHPREEPKRKRLACSKCFEYNHRVENCPSKEEFCPSCASKHSKQTDCRTIELRCITCMRRKLNHYHKAQTTQCPIYREYNNLAPLPKQTNTSNQMANENPRILQQVNTNQSSYSSALKQSQEITHKTVDGFNLRDMILQADNKIKGTIQALKKYEERTANRVAGAYAQFGEDKKEQISRTLIYLNDQDMLNRIEQIKTNAGI